jgi:uncharacterized protein
MSANVDLIRRYYAASNRRDIEAALEMVDPEIEFRLAGVFPDLATTYRGHEGILEFFERFNEPWEELSVDPERVIDLGDRVLVLIRFHATGRDGIAVQLPLAHLWTFRDGLAVRLQAFPDQAQALEAAGVEPG